MIVIIGVTSAGKTTYITQMSGVGGNVINFHEIRPWTSLKNKTVHINIFKILDAKNILNRIRLFKVFREVRRVNGSVHIIACNKEEVLNRISKRKFEDDTERALYNSDSWFERVSSLNFALVYETLILSLESLGLPVVCVWSQGDRFEHVKRYSFGALFRGDDLGSHLYNSLDINPSQAGEYQSISLGSGVKTSGQVRAESILKSLSIINEDDSILDVGSAIGALVFSAKNISSGKVVGFEPMSKRYDFSSQLRNYFNLDCELENSTIDALPSEERFDHVYCLNVLHHVVDFTVVLRLIVNSCNKTLTLELPHVNDNKFFDTLGRPFFINRKNIPLIGVSLESADQTFVYNASAIVRIIRLITVRNFEYEILDSPFSRRYIIRIYFDGYKVPPSKSIIMLTRSFRRMHASDCQLVRFLYNIFIRKNKSKEQV
jgi:hypothetical protein